VPVPRLVVVDYAEEVSTDGLRILLDRLRVHAQPLAPVRVLLLTRTASGSLPDVLSTVSKRTTAALRTILDGTDESDAARILSREQRHTLYTVAVNKFRRAWSPASVVSAQESVPDLASGRYELPLEVLFEAFDHALSDDDGLDTDRAPVDRVIDHEQRYWDATAPAELPARLRRHVVALATLATAGDDEQADDLLTVLPDLAGTPAAGLRRRTTQWLAGLYPGPGKLNPLRPDRLGEAMVASVLVGHNDGGQALLNAVLALPADGQVAHSLHLLARLSATDPAVAGTVAAILAAGHAELIQRAETVARGTTGRPGRLGLATGLTQLLAGNLANQVERLVAAEPGNTTYARDLSVSYERLGVVAREAGDVATSEALFAGAVDSRRVLHRREPARVDLAEELSVALCLLAGVIAKPAVTALKGEVVSILEPFERAKTITPKGVPMLSWARDDS